MSNESALSNKVASELVSEFVADESTFENVSEKFSSELLISAQKKTWALVRELASELAAGWTEEQAQKEMDVMFAREGAEKKWHPSKIRFGVNSTKSFRELSEPGVVLKENDIFFIDIGSVFFGHEADCGQTFVLKDNQLFSVKSEADAIWAEQSDYYKLKLASEKLFSIVANKWKNENEENENEKDEKKNKLSGVELYEYAAIEAEKMGYQLNLQGAGGHRIGDFPHAVFHKGALNQFKQKPQEQRWILEIQLRHPQLAVGAFFEDVL